ncbi:MAG: hypothetical protein GOV01_01135 [Candidatus Altiarchaeota archaeon]|nr:hypothetical protein [Candidatus Altiarchaeota archaeon]
MKIMSGPNLFPQLKNYWFIYGTEGKKQFVFMWGTVRGFLKINDKQVQSPDYFVVFWGYDPKKGKIVKIDDLMNLSFPPKEPFEFKFEDGKYFLNHEDTELVFGKDYAPPLVDGIWKIVKWKNEYKVVSGKLFGKKFLGKAYVQKVEARAPFTPWNWLRFQGKNIGDLFQIIPKKSQLIFNGVKYPVEVSAKDGFLHLTSDKVDLKTTPYEDYTVNFSGIGKFRYTEFLVEVKGVVDGTIVEEYGMVEEARGIVV